jgi:hypothetical protein
LQALDQCLLKATGQQQQQQQQQQQVMSNASGRLTELETMLQQCCSRMTDEGKSMLFCSWPFRCNMFSNSV